MLSLLETNLHPAVRPPVKSAELPRFDIANHYVMLPRQLANEMLTERTSKMIPRTPMRRKSKRGVPGPAGRGQEAIRLEILRILKNVGQPVTLRDAQPHVPSRRNHVPIEFNWGRSATQQEFTLTESQRLPDDAVGQVSRVPRRMFEFTPYCARHVRVIAKHRDYPDQQARRIHSAGVKSICEVPEYFV